MVNPTQADPCLLMESRACPLCLEDCSIREGSAVSKDSPVGHVYKLGVQVRHPIHLGCIYKIIEFSKGLCARCPFCLLEVKKEELHILKLVSVEGAADRTRIETTLVSNSIWKNVEEEIASSGKVSTTVLCAAAAAGEVDLMRQYIEEGLIFRNDETFTAAMVLANAVFAGKLAIVKLLLEQPASKRISIGSRADLLIGALEKQEKEIARILYAHLPPNPLGDAPEDHLHTLEDMMETLEAARKGDEQTMAKKLENWERYDTARLNIVGTLLCIATTHARSGILNQLLTMLPSKISSEDVQEACLKAIYQGNGLLPQLLTSRGLDLSYGVRIRLVSISPPELSIEERTLLLDMNPPKMITSEVVAALERLRRYWGVRSESLSFVIQYMNSDPTGRAALSTWMNDHVIDWFNLNKPDHDHFLNMLLSQGIVMHPKVAGGCAIAVADAPSRFADQELSSLLQKICLQTDGAIGDNDKWTILLFAVRP
jgi:hypothetical protein